VVQRKSRRTGSGQAVHVFGTFTAPLVICVIPVL
jgi:hypothetical protein